MKTTKLNPIILVLALAAGAARAGDATDGIFGLGYDLFVPDMSAAGDSTAANPAPAKQSAIPFDQIGAKRLGVRQSSGALAGAGGRAKQQN